MKTSKFYQFSEDRLVYLKGGPESYVPDNEVSNEEFEQEMANLTAEIAEQDLNDLAALRAGMEELNGPEGQFRPVDGHWNNTMRSSHRIDSIINMVEAIQDHSVDLADIDNQFKLKDVRAYLELARLYKKQPEILQSVKYSGDLLDAILAGEITDDAFVDFYPKHYIETMGGDWYYDMLDDRTPQVFEFAGIDPWDTLVDLADGGKTSIVIDHFDQLSGNFELSREQQLYLVDLTMAHYYELAAERKTENPGVDMVYPSSEPMDYYIPAIAKLQSIRDGL